ncbi:MAG: type II secretion system GspH family protein [Fusobacterium sp.]|nr:type II secretion system GspH family protein [Fusobacterium sp.]
MNKLKGFTLSEILIAMLVLGIIIAASVPVILQMTPNKNAIMMKKAYYATETIIESLINDVTYYPEDESAPGFQNTEQVKVAGTTIDTTAASKLACLFASKLNIKQDLASVCAGSPTLVTTMDGMDWDLSGLTNGATNYLRVDVDGEDNGLDQFYTTITGTCPAVYTWNGTGTCGAATAKTKKKFDRILITIGSDGSLSIPADQEAFIDILSGKTKLIGGDED